MKEIGFAFDAFSHWSEHGRSKMKCDEDIDDIRTTTPAARVAPSPTEAALPQVVHPQDAPL
jgi:hypothetical protein